MELRSFLKRKWLTLSLLFYSAVMYAQGNSAIGTATQEISSYGTDIGNLTMAIGGIVGLIGAIRVYIKWQNGDQDVTKSIMGWGGAMIFLVVSGAIVKAFFP